MTDGNDILIALTDIRKEFVMGAETVAALRGVTLSIRRGEYVAVMGPSGSGKSTLMNILGCLDRPTAGRYVLAGTDVSELSENRLAEVRNREIGFVFQTFNLLPRVTAAANVELPLIYARVAAGDRRARAAEALASVGLGHRVGHKPNEMSGGERQRVAIARALVNSPSLLLADEPTGNLDTKTSAEIMDVFDLIHARGNTIVVVTHEDDISERARRRIRLRDGAVIVDEPTARGRGAVG
jgi:putative ABC transport system ATP-binding protein